MSIGKSLPHDAAPLHVTGGARYVDDIPTAQGTLHLAFGLSSIARGRIRGMDLVPVRAASGVVAVIADPDPMPDCSPSTHDEPLLAGGDVHYLGQPLFIVVATSHLAARKAARLARVDYAPVTPILTVDEAMAAGSRFEDGPVIWQKGDPAIAIAAAPNVIEGRMEVGGQEHFYLEGQVSLAIPQEGGDMVVHASTQHPTEIQHKVAHALHLPMNAVRVEVRRMGGGFGGKESQGNALAIACALAARATGRPCKMRYDRDDDMMITGKRHDLRIEYRAGFDHKGRIAGLEFRHLMRCGWAQDLSLAVADRAMLHADNCYHLPAIRIESHRLRTNTQSATAFRGFGGPQGMIGIERVVDHVAHHLNRDPLEVRRANFYDAMGTVSISPGPDALSVAAGFEINSTPGQRPASDRRDSVSALSVGPDRDIRSLKEAGTPPSPPPAPATRVPTLPSTGAEGGGRMMQSLSPNTPRDMSAENVLNGDKAQDGTNPPLARPAVRNISDLAARQDAAQDEVDLTSQGQEGVERPAAPAPIPDPAIQTTPYHMPVEDFIAHGLVEELERTSDYAARRRGVADWNANNDILKKGIALTPVKFGISFTLTWLNQAGALVHVYQDGSIHLNHGGTEMGQGLFQKVAQVAASVFGVDPSVVKITATDTGKVPNTSATAASSGSDMNGMAARAACLTIRDRIADALGGASFADGHVTTADRTMTFAEAAQIAYQSRVSLSATGFYKVPKITWDRKNGTGRPFFYFAYGAAVSEVVIDTLTGESRILRADILHDTGNSLNPALDIGQIEGAYVQGAGWLTTEELVWDDKGALTTHAPSTYKIPACSDRPRIFNVALWGRPNPEDTVGRSKAVGEPPFMLGISVFMALQDAVRAAGGGLIDAPATPERILRAVQDV